MEAGMGMVSKPSNCEGRLNEIRQEVFCLAIASSISEDIELGNEGNVDPELALALV